VDCRPAAVLIIAAAGVFYAWLRDRSGSVWPVAIGHTFGNTTFSWGLAVVAPTTSTSLTAVAGPSGVAAFVVLALLLLRTAKVWKAAPGGRHHATCWRRHARAGRSLNPAP
jgi:membrane protease YdiL (CAAX protease family)